ncbi:MAG: GGDEF domain-containing protein [Sphingomonas sp.]
MAARWLDRMIAWAAGLTRHAAWVISIGLIGPFIALDWATGPNLSFNGFYILIICFAAWSLRLMGGLVIGAVFGVASFGLNGFGDSFMPHAEGLSAGVALWNLLMRGCWVAVVVVLVAGFRRSYETQRHRARTDDLTGALTKHAFRDHLNRSVTAGARRGFSLVMIYSDLDGFKAVNDRFGHGAGDAVLVAFSDAAARTIRSRDVLARMGGDEFVMLLTVETADDGFAAAERVHRTVGKALAELPYPVTASMGAIIVERPRQTDQAAILEMADALMYEVKAAGKNALRIAYVDRPRLHSVPMAEAA